MRLVLFVVALLALPPARVAAVSSESGRSRQLQAMEARERAIRGLSQLRPVPARFLSNKAFNAVISAQMRQSNPPAEIAVGQRELQTVGFLPPHRSLKKILLSGISGHVAGMYDDKTRTLYVRARDNQAFGLERRVIVHEYTHALQDQHWNLRRIIPTYTRGRYRNSDALTARHAFVEGDAVTTETLYIAKAYTPGQYRAMIAYEQRLPQGAPLPWAIERQFYFPYTTGLGFAATLYRAGGMQAIDSAYSRLPSSTYEIMFPEAYLRHWTPTPVALHSVRGFPGWKQTDDDVFGAFGYKMLLWQRGTEQSATDGVRSYRGDRYVFLQRGRQSLLFMRSRWSTPAACQAARRALSRSLQLRFGRSVSWRYGKTVISAPGTSVYLHAAGDSLILAYAPTAALARRLGTAHTR